MIIGLTGAAGCGKDTVAGILASEYGFQPIAFSDTLYDEVSEAFQVPISFLKNRDTKERPTRLLSMRKCADADFVQMVSRMHGIHPLLQVFWRWKRWSPRQILQWWGDYRRDQSELYLIDRVRGRIVQEPDKDWVVIGVRCQGEVDLLSEFDGVLGLVMRQDVEPVAEHRSESFWQVCAPDMVIENHGTLDDLFGTVREAVISLPNQ